MSHDAVGAGSSDGPLAGVAIRAATSDVATAYAMRLLQGLGAGPAEGAEVVLVGDGAVRTPAQDWAASGALALTGRADGPPLHPVGAPASAVRGALLAFEAVARRAGIRVGEDWPGVQLLGERAAIAGLTRNGPRSVGGAFRLLATADGWVGITLARACDVDLLPALTSGAVPASLDDGVAALTGWLSNASSATVCARARLLGLPLAPIPDGAADEQLVARWDGTPSRPVALRPGAARARARERPVVVNLSSLWAGPLAAHLLGLSGADVLTVESPRRPDGARRGAPAFYDLLHAGHASVALDLPDPSAVELLRRILARADLVIESSRPRAMRRLGIDVDEVVDAGTAWVSITGYGRTGPWADLPAFGDDAATAGGLVAWDERGPVPAGDAIADPLAGVHAAVAGLAALHDDRSWLVDIAMREVAVTVAGLPAQRTANGTAVVPTAPTSRVPARCARPLGADTGQVLARLGLVP